MNSQHDTPIQDLAAACASAIRTASISVQAVYLMGSWGTPYEREDSDLDLAILAVAPLDLDKRMRIEEALHACMPLPEQIDIVDLRQADTVFAAHAVSEGRRLLTEDCVAATTFEMHALSRYARLNEERRGILADIRARGTVYGAGLSP